MQHVRNAILKGIDVTGLTGSLVETNDVTGTGLESAAKYAAPR